MSGDPEEATAELLEILEEDAEPEFETPDIQEELSAEWLDRQNGVPTPLALLDSNLSIRWRNAAFKDFRETQGLEYRGRPFPALFSNFADKESRNALFQSLHSPKEGFAWKGLVEGRGPEGRKFYAHVSIIPAGWNHEEIPRWYIAVTDDLTESRRSIVRANFDSILQASLLKDEDTGNHIKRVNSYSRLLAQSMKGKENWLEVNEDFIDDIGFLASFHDVGKIGTPESILLKADKLNDEEWRVMKEHPINGALILDAHPNPMAKNIARSHHERWNGTGYPFSLAGEDIPLTGRIVALADVYDALRTRRPYKEPFSEEKTYEIVVADSGTHFDPKIVDIFRSLRSEFNEVFESLKDE